MLNVTGRHPGVVEFADAFEFSHLPEGLPRSTSATFHRHAAELLELLPDGPALIRALHKLWESKNEAVLLAVRESRKVNAETFGRHPNSSCGDDACPICGPLTPDVSGIPDQRP